MKYKLGLKIGSIDTKYTDEIIQFYEKGIFQYIELFTLSGTYEDTISYWKGSTGCRNPLRSNERIPYGSEHIPYGQVSGAEERSGIRETDCIREVP